MEDISAGKLLDQYARFGVGSVPRSKITFRVHANMARLSVLEIYMIGRTEDSAAPKILICSADIMARKEVRRAIMGSGIMNSYPAIGLGDTG